MNKNSISTQNLEWLTSFPETNPDPILELNLTGEIIYFNSAARSILESTGFTNEFNRYIPADFNAIIQTLTTGVSKNLYREIKLANLTFAESIFYIPQYHTIRIYAVDITKQRDRHKFIVDVLNILNEPIDKSDIIRDLLILIKNYSNIEAVGIRLREGEDFPYYLSNGFPVDFIESERSLCERDWQGKIVHDTQGNPVLECMCGNVIRGRTNSMYTYFTDYGSFWTNSTTELLATTTEQDRQSRTRNRCHGEGYESVALIPLRTGQETIGLLQLNDRRKDRYNLEIINFFEQIGISIGIALSRIQAEENIKRRIVLEKTISAISTRFAGIYEFDQMINESLTQIGLLSSANRAYLFIFNIDGKTMTNTHEWCATGVTPQKDNLQNLPINTFPWWMEKLRKNEVIHIVDVSSLPEEAKNEREILQAQDIKSLLSLPLNTRSGLVGFIGLDNTQTTGDWKTDNLRILRVSSEIIGSAIERKQIEEEKEIIRVQLLHSQKMDAIGQLTGGIAHDFNNLLTGILGYSSLILNSLSDTDPIREDIQEIKKASERAATLIRQLLTFSRKQILQTRIFDLNVLITDINKMLDRIIGENIKLAVRLDTPQYINADTGQIEQVIMNLIVNSRDAMPTGGTIGITTNIIDIEQTYSKLYPGTKPGRYVCLTIQDTGTGIAKETIAHIFDPFFTTKKDKGNGLGLSIAYGIIKQHEGWITVDSEIGKGTIIKIYLPNCNTNTGKPEEIGNINYPDENTVTGERVLVVEDEESILMLAKTVLEKNGYIVFTALNVEQAMAIFIQENYNLALVFSDVILPDQTGIQLTERIWGLKPDTKIVLGSGYIDEKRNFEFILNKNIPFIPKPYTISDLLKIVKQTIGSKK